MVEPPLHPYLWICAGCGTTENTKHSLFDFMAYCPACWPCDGCRPKPQRESEVA